MMCQCRIAANRHAVVVNNYFGRQFNSLNDVAVHPTTGEIYFTDTQYGELQAFRPSAGLRNSVYRYNYETGALAVVADGFVLPNGTSASPLINPRSRDS